MTTTVATRTIIHGDGDGDMFMSNEKKHHHLLVLKNEKKKPKLSPFSDLSDDQMIAIFGDGPPFRFEFYSALLRYTHILHHTYQLSGTIHVGFSPDPLLQHNGFSDVFNREFTNPLPVESFGYDWLHDLRYCSLPVTSTSSVRIAAKLYVTSDKVDDMEIFTDDYMDRHTRCPQPTVDPSVLREKQALLDKISKVFDNDYDADKRSRQLGSNLKATCTLQKTVKKEPCYIDDYALQVCDAHAFINIPDKPSGGSGTCTIKGKDGSLEISYVVLKYAVYADLEIEFQSISQETKLTGSITAYYGKDFDYDRPADQFYNAMLWNIDDPAFVKPGKLNLMRSVLAVPAKSSLIIEAYLYDEKEILSEDYEFFVPRDFRSSVVTKSGKGWSLKVTVNWKLPKSPAPSSNSSVSRLVKTERSKFGARSTSIMADPDGHNRWSLQEEIANVFNTSLERTFNPQEAVSCSISTCTIEDGGDYLCSSVLHIWPELRDTSYRGPKHAGVAVKDNIMASVYKDMMERCVVCGPGFVKFKLCREWIAKSIDKMLRVGIHTWAPTLTVKKAIIYSLSPPAMLDDAHMGHLRSTCVGETLARMLEYSGIVVRQKSIHDRDHLDIEGKWSYDLYITKTLDLLRGKGLTVVSEGDETVFIEGRRLPLVYLTALRHALDVEIADWIVHVADVGQQDYIETCINAAKRVGLITDDHSKYPLSHVGFGHVEGDDLERFQISSLVNLFDEAKTRCKVLLAGQAGMGDVRTAEEIDHAAELLGYGAVMYENLKNNRLTNYTFSFDQMLNEKGNTAVYLHYTHHQVCLILRSSSTKELLAEELILMNDDERELGLHLLRFTEILGEACIFIAPHILCEYLYELCNKFNGLRSSVWQVVGSSEKTSKLLLCKATKVVMWKCFVLLGITPESPFP